MEPASTTDSAQTETTILARIFGDQEGHLSPALARHLLQLGFGEDDKARMHDLSVRNQAGELSDAERQELFAYDRAGTLLSILKSKARRALRDRTKRQSRS